MAEWVLACLQRKVFSEGGGGGSSQVVLSIWLSLFITEIFYFPCHHLEEGFSKLAGNLGANNEYFSLRVTFLLLLKTLIRERLLIRPNTPIVISLHHLLKSFFYQKKIIAFSPRASRYTTYDTSWSSSQSCHRPAVKQWRPPRASLVVGWAPAGHNPPQPILATWI